MLWPRRVCFQFAPQAGNVHPQGTHVRLAWTPHLLEHVLVGYNTVCLANEAFQNAVLEGSELDIFTGRPAGDSLFEIDACAPERYHRIGLVGSHDSPHDRASPSQ